MFQIASRFWVGGGASANWNATGNTNWAETSGGANNASVPGSSDDVFFDGNGNSASTISAAITIRSLSIGAGYTATLTHSGVTIDILTNLVMGANMTYTHNIGSVIRFSGTTTGNTITTNGKIMRSITINGSGGGWTLQDALTQSPGVFNFSWGTLNTNGMTITCPTNFSVTGTAARTLTLGASSIILNGTGTQFDATTTTNLTFNPNTSTITATNTSATAKTFIGGNLTFNDLTISGDNITISGNNIFNTLAVNNGGRTNGLIFTAGSTQTVSFFTTNGSSGSLAIIKSSSAGSAATLTAATAGQVSVDYMSIKDSTATGGAGWYAGANSTNVSGNTGWTFTIPPGAGQMTVNKGFW